MMRPSSRKILLSACFLLVLASGIMTQIAGQSTVSIAICLDIGSSELEILINDGPFCILLSEFTGDANTLQMAGDAYEGTCDSPGNLIGPFTGSLSLESGSGDEFMTVIDFTISGTTSGTLHSESKFTGDLLTSPDIALEK